MADLPGAELLLDFILKILALDTSSEHCSVALFQKGETISREVFAEQRHSMLILPMIRQVLEEANLNLSQLDGIAFGAGPGSFTGLRIACGITQGLALGAGLPVVGICTLEALAEEIGSGNVIAALDARMNEIYHAAYEKREEGWEAVREPVLCFPEDAPAVPEGEWTACGSGFDRHGPALRSRYEGYVSDVVAGIAPHAWAIAQLAPAAFKKGLAVDPGDATPFYIRNKVALKENER